MTTDLPRVEAQPPLPAEPSVRARRSATLFLSLAGAMLWLPLVHKLTSRDQGFLANLGFVSGPPGTPLAWLLGIAAGVGYAAFTIRNVPFVRAYWRRISVLKLVAIVVAVAAAVVEEAFFRRFVMDEVEALGGAAWMAVLLSGLTFGAAHASWSLATGQLAVGLQAGVATGILGAAFGVVYLAGDRSLAPPIVGHFIVTAAIQPGILFAAFGGGMRREAAARAE